MIFVKIDCQSGEKLARQLKVRRLMQMILWIGITGILFDLDIVIGFAQPLKKPEQEFVEPVYEPLKISQEKYTRRVV